jgi:hypothetical protein
MPHLDQRLYPQSTLKCETVASEIPAGRKQRRRMIRFVVGQLRLIVASPQKNQARATADPGAAHYDESGRCLLSPSPVGHLPGPVTYPRAFFWYLHPTGWRRRSAF